jgi:hypothetical protein
MDGFAKILCTIKRRCFSGILEDYMFSQSAFWYSTPVDGAVLLFNECSTLSERQTNFTFLVHIILILVNNGPRT